MSETSNTPSVPLMLSNVSRAIGLAKALAEARDPEVSDQHEASRRIAGEIVRLLEPVRTDLIRGLY